MIPQKNQTSLTPLIFVRACSDGVKFFANHTAQHAKNQSAGAEMKQNIEEAESGRGSRAGRGERIDAEL